MGKISAWLSFNLPTWMMRVLIFLFSPRSWDELRRAGSFRMVRMSPVWMAGVPIAATVMNGLDNPVINAIDLALPLSWIFLFYASVFFSIFSVIFSFGCPAIIRDFTSYAEFKKRGEGSHALLSTAANLAWRNDLLYDWTYVWPPGCFLRSLVRQYGNPDVSIEFPCEQKDEDCNPAIKGACTRERWGDQEKKMSLHMLDSVTISDEEMPRLYSYLRAHSAQLNRFWRRIATYSLGLGIACAIWVLLLGICEVTRALVR